MTILQCLYVFSGPKQGLWHAVQAKTRAEEAQRDLAELRSSSNADLEGHQASWQTRRAELEAEVGLILTWQLALVMIQTGEECCMCIADAGAWQVVSQDSGPKTYAVQFLAVQVGCTGSQSIRLSFLEPIMCIVQ